MFKLVKSIRKKLIWILTYNLSIKVIIASIKLTVRSLTRADKPLKYIEKKKQRIKKLIKML